MSFSFEVIISGIVGVFIGGGLVYIFLSTIIKKHKKRSLTDELTGLYNAREFKVRLSAEIARSKRHNLPFSILLIDIDKFKRINDSYGYKTGDKVLCDLVNKIQSQLRASDLLFRYKLGDEFIIMALNTDKNGAETLSKRLKEIIKKHDFLIGKQQTKQNFTISIGISDFDFSNPKKDMEKEAEKGLREGKS